MKRLTALGIRIIALVVVAVVVVGAGYYYFFGRVHNKTVTASFASGVGVYPGTPVDILGIKVGTVKKVTPDGGSVRIELAYDAKYKVPANAIAYIYANSLVSDRYIQLEPAYPGHGAVLADKAAIPLNRTGSPAELDDIYGALNQLSVALGPTGANSKGALSTLVNVGAANLKGNGADLGNSISALSKAAKTLADGRGDLFATVRNLQSFTAALAQSNTQVVHFEQQLAQVSGQLAAERGDLATALRSLTSVLSSVSTFISQNAGAFHTDVSGLASITTTLVKEKGSLDESLAVAPVALSNIVHAYNTSDGVLGTRSNLSSLTDPSQVCGLLSALIQQGGGAGGLLGSSLKVVTGILSGVTTAVAGAIVSTCKSVAGALSGGTTGAPGLPDLTGLLGSLLGGLGGIPGAGLGP